METNSSLSIIKLEHEGKIFRLSEVPKSLDDLVEVSNRYFPDFKDLPENSVQITCKSTQNDDLFLNSQDKYIECLQEFVLNKAKAIKFVLRKKKAMDARSVKRSSFNMNDEKETFDTELKSSLCIECSENFGTALDKEMICEKCKAISKDVLKKITKSLSPPSNCSCYTVFRKNSYTCHFEEKKRETICPKQLFLKSAEYRAKILCSNENQFTFHNLKKNEGYELKINFFNSGNRKWPKNMRLKCISGIFEGFEVDVKPLDMQESCEVNIHLESPDECGRFNLAWRLCYQFGGKLNYFGPRVVNEIYVSDL